MKNVKRIGSPILQWIVATLLFYSGWKWLLAPHVSRLFIVNPDLVLSQLRIWWDDGSLVSNSAITVKEAMTGYFIGASTGVFLALMVGLLPSIFGKCVEPVVTAIYASPKFVIVPLLFVWLGAGFTPRVVLISLSVFALLFINTVTGIRTVDTDRARMLELLGADRKQMAQKLLLPHTMGYITTGLTTSAPFAITIAVGSEILFGTTNGLGGVMYTESQLFNALQVLASLVIATAISSIAISTSRYLAQKLAGSGGRFARL